MSDNIRTVAQILAASNNQSINQSSINQASVNQSINRSSTLDAPSRGHPDSTQSNEPVSVSESLINQSSTNQSSIDQPSDNHDEPAPDSSIPPAQWESNVDLGHLFNESPFDQVCVKHMQRLLSSYHEVYNSLITSHSKQQSLINEQHKQRVSRLKEQQRLKRLREHERHDAQHHIENQSTNQLRDPPTPITTISTKSVSNNLNVDASIDHQSTPTSSPPVSTNQSTYQSDTDHEVVHDASPAENDTDYAEMKAELDLFYRAQLMENTRRHRNQILSLSQRCDAYLSSQLQPSQLLSVITLNLTIKTAGQSRVIMAPLTIHCVETFSDLRKRFVHYMREEEGDSVLAFTSDSQFRIDSTFINSHCRINLKDAVNIVRSPAIQSHGHEDLSPEQQKSDSYSMQALSAFVSRATRSTKFTYGPPLPPLTQSSPPVPPPRPSAQSIPLSQSTTNQSSSPNTNAHSTLKIDVPAKLSNQLSVQTSNSLQPSPSSHSSTLAYSPASSTESSVFSFTQATTTHTTVHSSHSQMHTASQSFSQSATTPVSITPAMQQNGLSQSTSSTASPAYLSPVSCQPGYIIILNEDIAVAHFLPDFATTLDIHMLGAVVLVSDQAPNAAMRSKQKHPVTPTPPPAAHQNVATEPSAAVSHLSSFLPQTAAMAAATGRAFAAVPRQAAKLLPSRLRGLNANRPPLPQSATSSTQIPALPKMPPSLSSFFNRPPVAPVTQRDAMNGTNAVPMGSASLNDSLTVGEQSRSNKSSDSSDDSFARMSVHDFDEHTDVEVSVSQKQRIVSTSSANTRRFPRRIVRDYSINQSTLLSRYAGLSVDVDHDLNDRVDSIAPSQSYSMDIPFIDYDEDPLDPEDDDLDVEPSVNQSVSMRSDLRDDLMDVDGELIIDPDHMLMNEDEASIDGRRSQSQRSSNQMPEENNENDMINTLIHSQSFSHISLDSTPLVQSVTASSHLRQSSQSRFDVAHLLGSTPSLGAMQSSGVPPLPGTTPPPFSRMISASPASFAASPITNIASPLIIAQMSVSPNDQFLAKHLMSSGTHQSPPQRIHQHYAHRKPPQANRVSR